MPDYGNQGSYRLRTTPGVAFDDRRLRGQVQRVAQLRRVMPRTVGEAIDRDRERQSGGVGFQLVKDLEALLQPPGVDEDKGADGAFGEAFPQVPEPPLPRRAEQVEDQG